MEIIVKRQPANNHVYVFDDTMRPLSIDIKGFDETQNHIDALLLKHQNITDIRFVDEIDNSKTNYT